MRARNKFETEVLKLSGELCPLGKRIRQWAFREGISHFAYRLAKGQATCMDCGHSWHLAEQEASCHCPLCRAKVQVVCTRRRKESQKCYFNVLTSYKGYQVLRMFLLAVGMEKGCRAEQVFTELGQYWWDALGRQCIIAVQRCLGRYVDCFAYASPKAVRRDNEAYRYVASSLLYPHLQFIPELQLRGLGNDCHGIAPAVLIPALLKDCRVETLLKAGRSEHLRYFLQSERKLTDYFPAYKITLRRKYDIPDIALWCSYIDKLRRLDKDTHNACFVCPENLTEANAKALRTLQRKQARKAEAERQTKALQEQERFQVLKAPFFGLQFSDGSIKVRVLERIEEYAEEGKALHHCVFENRYYLKEHSLILSATLEGKHLETIELSLETMQVIQCRGLLNQNSEYHERIIALVHANRELISQRMIATA